ncbi:sigma 54-interacting transcriptional regulator [Bacillus sp. H-16]|uniref:sigma-54 interaction domain-containing protein n=1 Tax=Alteribacter salitolerans TaxID=2912333 RepID=UPI0019634086|nr:sigma 54-interacting transcriptional regulator [Alteribacter salitolerans]MBM7095754.1 sigma 54-interacting transcriptional regulator [Alteribacter salitolerans]
MTRPILNDSERILQALKDDLLVTDCNGTIMTVSEETKKLYGIEGRNVVGETVYQLQKEGVFTPIVTPLVLEKKDRVNVVQTTRYGKKLLITGVPVFDADGNVWRIASYSHDITEMANMETHLKDMQDEMKRVKHELDQLRLKSSGYGELFAESPPMKACLDTASRVAAVDVNVLLLGESGVGKTHLAKMIHQKSPRNKGPFIEVNCGSIPESLFEAEFFGYEGGAFTGASKKGKVGLAETSEGGTLFLDEIGELSLSLQVKLLKFIQEKQFYRVGGTKPKSLDFRLIAATNQPLQDLVVAKEFREDLYFRLSVVPIHIPPMRERPEDLAPLISHFLHLFSEKYERKKMLDDAVMQELYKQEWQGNVRELMNLIERLVVTSHSQIITHSDLPQSYRDTVSPLETSFQAPLRQTLDGVEERILRDAKKRWKTTVKMAEVLGISQPSIVRKLKKYRIND